MCVNCVAKSIQVQQRDKIWNQISCPACAFLGRLSLLPHESIKRYANQVTWERHEMFVARDALQANLNFMWCLSGNCEWGEIHDPKGERFICSACGFHTCFKHQIPWHEGLTCRQYDGLDKQPKLSKENKSPGLRYAIRKLLRKLTGKPKPVVMDPAQVLEAEKTATLMAEASPARGKARQTRKAVGRLTKKCPGFGCGVPIERASGCSRMRCGRCGCDFCFTCLRLWEYGHYKSCNDAIMVGGGQERLQARPAPRVRNPRYHIVDDE